jgi:hypothetical protein
MDRELVVFPVLKELLKVNSLCESGNYMEALLLKDELQQFYFNHIQGSNDYVSEFYNALFRGGAEQVHDLPVALDKMSRIRSPGLRRRRATQGDNDMPIPVGRQPIAAPS